MKGRRVFNSIRLQCVLLSSVFMLLSAGQAVAQDIWTLEECVLYALEHNIQIQQSKLEVDIRELKQTESKLSLLPSLNSGLTHSFGWGRSVDMATYQYVNTQTQSSYFNLSSDLALFSGFQKLNTIKQRRADYLAAKYGSDKMQNDISLTVAGYYLQILFSKELVNNARSQSAVTKQQMERTQKLVEAGTLARGSLLEIQAQDANEEVAIVQAENQLKLAYLDLLQLLELEAETPFEIEIPELSVSSEPSLLPVQYIYNKAMEIMPEIKNAEMNFESSTRALAIAKGSRSPDLSLSAALGTNYSDQIRMSNNPLDPDYERVKDFNNQLRDNRSTTLSIRLSIPIFNAYQISSYIGQSRLGLLNAGYTLDLAKNTLRKNVETAYADALAAHSTYKAREKSMISLTEAFHYTEQRFNLGMVNAVDYNLAKNQLSTAESELLSSKYDYLFKLKILDFYMGRPLSLTDNP
ncbi:MAG: TolC family protein [Bacteroidales bacterium]|jgi:outer membrane protein|nr:TolC family protein [Bacteroidales bacterium]MDD3702263.1 TolC family protein [Bacteroidales bacterium]MDY0368862.1 TolC family protein [Bacteroidales bacterium]